MDRIAIPRLHHRLTRKAICRTRTGCVVCRRRKIKCDERKPACTQCVRKHFDCDWATARTIFPPRAPDTSNTSPTATPSISDSPTALNLDSHSMHDSSPPSSSSFSASDNFSPLCQRTPTHSILGQNVRESFLPVFFQQVLGQVFHTIVDGPLNPFAVALLPLMQSSSTLLSAIQALTGICIGLKGRVPQARADGLKYQNEAIRQLARDLSDPVLANSDASLAASMILCICEQALGNQNLAAMQYLDGTRSIIRRRFFERPQCTQNTVTTATNLFIKQVVWQDILSNYTRPFSQFTVELSLNLLRLTDVLNDDGDINPFLFGSARDIFWVMIDLASFAQELGASCPSGKSGKASRIDRLRRAIRLEERLQAYDMELGICLYHGNEPLSTTDLQDCRLTVEIYRRTALIYLYQLIPGLVQQPSLDDLVRSVLTLMNSVSEGSRTIAFHVWCLVIVGSGCRCVDDRMLVLNHLKRIQLQFPLSHYADNAEALILEIYRKTDEVGDSRIDSDDWQFHWARHISDINWGIGYI